MKKVWCTMGIAALVMATACSQTDHFDRTASQKEDSVKKQSGVFKIKKAAIDSVKIGKELFESVGCTSCHAMGHLFIGPDLTDVTKRKSRKWITGFTRNPDIYLDSDPYAKVLLHKYGARMAGFRNITDTTINFLCAYFEDCSRHKIDNGVAMPGQE